MESPAASRRRAEEFTSTDRRVGQAARSECPHASVKGTPFGSTPQGYRRWLPFGYDWSSGSGVVVCTLRGSSVTVLVVVLPSWPKAVRSNVCALEQLNGRIVLPFVG